MGIFDSLKQQAAGAIANHGASQNAGSKNHSETFTFSAVPTCVAELQALPEASLDTPFKTAALTLLALAHFEANPEETFAMIDFLKGPGEVSNYEKQFIKERLNGKGYKVLSYFAGATPENGYTPTAPLQITVSDNPYSFNEENWGTLWVRSSGADNPRAIKLRKKPSTGQWFLNDIQCLSDVRIPVSADPWA